VAGYAERVPEIELESAPGDKTEPATEQGRELSLDAAYRAHAELVSRWIRRLDPSGDAEDLLHEVFLVASRRLSSFRGDAAVTTWLYAITLRVVAGKRRKRKLRRLLFGGFAHSEGERPGPPTPEADATRAEASRVLYELFDELSERDRTVLILFELEGLSGKQIAEVTGIAEHALWTVLHRARGRLRRAYVSRYGEPGRGR
jgi:RNA polymerase sigma-70 factor (ECF subfamily)